MNGLFFKKAADGLISEYEGKYLSLLNGAWVISKEPYESNGTFGNPDEWQTLYDIESGEFLPSTEKTFRSGFTAVKAEIVDVNVIGSFVDYVIKYSSASDGTGRCAYYRERNIDGVWQIEDYSILYVGAYNDSILGSYNENQSYIKNFNNSVMLNENLRVIINGNTAVGYSYTVNRNRIGTLLIPYGDLIENFIPCFYLDNQKQYIISKTSTGFIRITRIGTDVPSRIERMAQYVHKINTIDPLNILVEREGRITVEPGSLDWNNKFIINNNYKFTGILDITTYHVNSAYNPNYEVTGKRSSSIIVSDTTFNLYGSLKNTAIEDSYNLEFIGAFLSNESIDVFYDNVQPSKYKYSLINNIQRFNSLLDGLSFPLGVLVPFPLGTKWSLQNEIIAVGEMSKELLAAGLTNTNKTLDIYEFSNQIYFGQDSFMLYGNQYTFDGDYVYLGSDRIAMAFGYKFIGCDNNSAYFYNSWDNSIYQFNGSRDLVKLLDFSNMEQIKIGRFDGFSGEMILLTENEIIKNRANVIMNYENETSDNLNNIIIPTKKGSYIELKDGKRLLLSPNNGDIEEFEIKTGFIGIDGSTLCDYERIDIRLYSPSKKPVAFNVEMQTINQDTKESEQKQIEIKGNDWSSDGYKTIKLIPQYKKGTGLSLRVNSKEEIFIAGIEFTYNPVGRTSNGQKDGF